MVSRTRVSMIGAPALVLAVALLLLPGSSPLPPQDKPITYSQVDASRLDPQLPHVPFSSWLESVVGEDARIDWDLIECRQESLRAGTASRGVSRQKRGRYGHAMPQEESPSAPLCAEIDARLAQCGRVRFSIIVGSAARGIDLSKVSVLGWIEGIGPTVRVRSLPELPARLAEARKRHVWLQSLPPQPVEAGSAIDYVKSLKASDLDDKLDRTKFSTWFRHLAGVAEKVAWRLDRCDPMARRRSLERCDDEWACVHAWFENDLDAVSVAIVVGTYRRGIFGDPQVYSTRHFVKTGQNFGIRQSALHEILAEFEDHPID